MEKYNVNHEPYDENENSNDWDFNLQNSFIEGPVLAGWQAVN